MKGVKENGINKDVPKGFIIVQTSNVKQPSLQPMIPIPHKKLHLKIDLILRSKSKKIQISHYQTSNLDSKKTCAALGIPPPSN
jgi:hypothetical protein